MLWIYIYVYIYICICLYIWELALLCSLLGVAVARIVEHLITEKKKVYIFIYECYEYIYIHVYIYMHISVYLGTRPSWRLVRSGGCSDRWAPENRKEEGIHMCVWMLWIYIYIYMCVYIYIYMHMSVYLGTRPPWRLARSDGCSDRWAPENRKEEGIHMYLRMLWIYIYECIYICICLYIWELALLCGLLGVAVTGIVEHLRTENKQTSNHRRTQAAKAPPDSDADAFAGPLHLG